MARVVYSNFTGGEVTPTLSSRYDLKKFGSFLQCCENFVPNLHGDVERRPGTAFIADIGEKAILLPFSFNTDSDNNYVLIFTAAGIKVGTLNGLVEDVSLSNPYSMEDIYDLSYAQVGDVLYLAHKNYALRKLTRSGTAPSYTWAISVVALNVTLSAPSAPAVTWHGDSGTYTLRYVVTAVSSDGVESIASSVGSASGLYPTDWVQGSYVSLSWGAVSGASEYNIYRESAGYYGFIGVSDTTSFEDQNYEPNTAMTPKKNWDPFANGNNPSTVCFHQQRMCLAGTKDNPAAFYMSRTGDYESFRKSSPMQDDDPVEYMLASGSIDDVKWMVSFGDLLIGTAGGEYQATSSGAAITGSDVQISSQTYWGSAALKPLIIGQSILHCQRSGHHIRDLYYSWESGGYNGSDLSVLSPQEVEGHNLLQWCFLQSPGSNVWLVRDDGVLLCLTYMKEQNVFSWSRHITDGKVISVAAVSGESGDAMLAVTERMINGEKKYFLERLVDRLSDDDEIKNAWFVDCGTKQEIKEAVNLVTGYGYLAGETVVGLIDGSPVEGLVVAEDGSVKLPCAGKTILLGLPYTSVLSPLPIETDTQEGTTVGKRRAYGKCTLRLFRSVGGKYAATQQGDLFDVSAWKERQQYDIPFLPDRFGAPCKPFSGDIDITLPSGQDTDTSIWLIQDRPMPFRVCAITMNVDFGEN